MNQQKIFIIIAASIGIISMFLPWVSISVDFLGAGKSTNGFSSGWGIASFLGFSVSIALSLIGENFKALEKKSWFIVIIAGLVAMLFTIIGMFDKPDVQHPLMDIKASIGIGAWLSFLSSLGILISAWIFKNPEDTLVESYNSLKKEIASKTSSTSSTGNIYPTKSSTLDELERLYRMKEEGKLSDDNYKLMKEKIIGNKNN